MLKFCFRRFCFSLGGVGFSVAAVQLVPYVSFSHQLHLTWEKHSGRVSQKLIQNVHDCAYDACVLVIRILTLPPSLHSFHSQHPLSVGTESVCQLPPRFLDCWRWYYSIKYTSCTGHLTCIGFPPVETYSVSDVFLSREIWLHSVSLTSTLRSVILPSIWPVIHNI